jgi:predicted Rossmann fold flavoprotein
MKNEEYDVIIIGGGASGLMAAAQASMDGKITLLLEKNHTLGAKLKISGGGRCNITHAQYHTHLLLQEYGKAEKLLYAAFSQFGVEDTFTFFENHGLPLVVEESGRVFPKSQKAQDVFNTLYKIIQANHVAVQTGTKVKKIISEGNKIISVETDKGSFTGKSFILSTGGISHPETGSTGDGFTWLQDLGHTIHKPTLTIVPLAVKEEWVKILSGVSLPSMKITFFMNNTKQFVKKGPILFTHFGISGPLILNSSSRVNDLLQEGEVTALIDMFPEKEMHQLDVEILQLFADNSNKALINVLKQIVPAGTMRGIASLLPCIDFDKKVNSITKDERRRIVQILKSAPLTITRLMGSDKAVAADGGLALTMVDMKTMRSKLYSNLYITGDLLHINRPSGGYSLQLCWTTGYIAGKNA